MISGMLNYCLLCIFQLINFIIQALLINYGLKYHAQIGTAFEGALTTSSACFLNSGVLLICYIFSEKSYKLIQASYFVSNSLNNPIIRQFFFLKSS